MDGWDVWYKYIKEEIPIKYIKDKKEFQETK